MTNPSDNRTVNSVSNSTDNIDTTNNNKLKYKGIDILPEPYRTQYCHRIQTIVNNIKTNRMLELQHSIEVRTKQGEIINTDEVKRSKSYTYEDMANDINDLGGDISSSTLSRLARFGDVDNSKTLVLLEQLPQLSLITDDYTELELRLITMNINITGTQIVENSDDTITLQLPKYLYNNIKDLINNLSTIINYR
jgi:hypothetical protein